MQIMCQPFGHLCLHSQLSEPCFILAVIKLEQLVLVVVLVGYDGVLHLLEVEEFDAAEGSRIYADWQGFQA